jgi:hypothetical protein
MVIGTQGIEDIFPQSYGGGMRLYPVSGTVNMPVLAATAATTNVQVAFTGQTRVRLNSQLLVANTLPNTTLSAATGTSVAGGKYEASIYVMPRWSVPALIAMPTDALFNTAVGRAAVDGDRALLVADSFDSTAQYLYRMYKRVSGAWVEREITFEAPEYFHMNLPCGKVESFTATLVAKSMSAEKHIYFAKTGFSNTSQMDSNALLRAPAGFVMAKVRYGLDGGNAPINIEVVHVNTGIPA